MSRRQSSRGRQRARRWAVLAVLTLAAQLGVLYLTHVEAAPPQFRLTQLLWAAAHKPVVCLVIALSAASVIFSHFALQLRGRHRLWVIGGWILALLLGIGRFHHEISAYARIIWGQL